MPEPKPNEGHDEKSLAQQILLTVDGLNKGISALKSDVEAMKTEVGALKTLDVNKVVEEFEKLRAGYEQVMKAVRNNRNNPGFIPGLEDESETKKFSLMRAMIGIKSGKWTNAGYEKEVIDLATKSAGQVIGVDSQGGYFVPDQVIADVITGFYARSVLINLQGDGTTRVSVLDGLYGIPVKVPKFNGGCIAYWIGEEDSYIQSQVNVGNVTGSPKKLGVLVRLTNEMQRFQSYGFETLLRADMMRALAAKVDWTIIYGTGTDDMPKGIMKNVNPAKIAAAAAAGTVPESVQVLRAETGDLWDGNETTNFAGGELDFDGIDQMAGALEDCNIPQSPSYAVISVPRYFRRLKQLKVKNFDGQSTDQPYLLGIPMLQDGKLRDLIGNFDKTTQMPSKNVPGKSIGATTDVANAYYGDVVAGNFDNILFGRWSGIEIEDDDGKGTGFVKDQTYVKARMYADVMMRHEASLVVCTDAKMRDA